MHRQLYRSLLRETCNGRRSDVIPWPYRTSNATPRTAADTRQVLRELVVSAHVSDSGGAAPGPSAGTETDCFEVLRHASALSRAC